jgi:integrase
VATIRTRNGRHMVRWWDHDGRQRGRTFRRLTDARDFAVTVEADKVRGVIRPDPTVTVRAYAEAWQARQVWRPTTAAQVSAQLNARILPAFGDRRLSTLRHSDVAAWVAQLSRDGLAPATVGGLLRRLRSILRSAAHDRLLDHNPADAVRPPRDPRGATEHAVALSPAQLAALLAALPERLRGFALVLALAGLRPGEAAGLTADRVDLLHKRMTVDRQLVTVTGTGAVFGPPKTASGVRVLPIADHLADALRAHLATHPTGPGGLLFTSKTGTALTRGTLSDTWRRATADLALPAGARGWHCLRHTYASAALAAGVPIPTVSKLLGHRSVAETMSVYAHAVPSSDEHARGAVAALLLAAAP